ncbi:MAG: helix-turn-helix transcriptional regulator [Victivallaceae bacterium]|nr:helix-turn-helix transcriptional regulator [Victivallaceae bacterium]
MVLTDLKSKVTEKMDSLIAGFPLRTIYLAESGPQILQIPYANMFPFFRVIFVLSGRRYHRFIQDGRITEIPLEKLEVLFVPPQCGLVISYMEDAEVLQINLSHKLCTLKYVNYTPQAPDSRKLRYDIFCKNPLRIPLCSNFTGNDICRLIETNAVTNYPERYFRNMMECLVYDVLELLSNFQMAKPSKAQYTWANICEYIDEYYQTDINRGNIAECFNLHPNHLSRLFKQFSHYTLNEYISHRRIEHARQCLCHDKVTNIAEIAYNSGFLSVQQFNRKFQQTVGISPGKFRIKTLKSK